MPGYIVSAEGDTLTGQVKYRNWDKSPLRIKFRTSQNQAVTEYSPGDIRGFFVSGEAYLSAYVDIDVSPRKTEDITFDPKPQIERDSVFLQVRITGPKSLYYLKDQVSKEHFYIGREDGYELLIYKRYYKRYQRKNRVIEDRKFAGRLNLYLQDCPDILKQINKTDYLQSSIEKLFEVYYDCVGAAIEFKKETEPANITLGIVGGATTTDLRFRSFGSFFLEATDYPVSLDPTGGIFMDIILPRTLRRLGIYNDLLYTAYATSGNYLDYTSATHYTSYETRFEYSYIKLSTLIRYYQPVGRLQLFGNIGFSNGWMLSEVNYLRRQRVFFSTNEIEEKEALEDTRRHETGWLVGAGAVFGKLYTQIRYEQSNSITGNIGLGLSAVTRKWYLLVGYAF